MWGHDSARLPLHPPGARCARRSGDPRHDRDRDARDGAGDRGCSGPRAGGRPHERRPAEPPLRRRDRRRRGGAAAARSSAGCTSCAARRRSSTRSRRSCESLARRCAPRPRRPSTTTPGSSPRSAPAAQEAFIEGRVQTVVATTAFGMGIDSRTSASSRSTTIRSRSRATCRWSAGPAGRPCLGHAPALASRADAGAAPLRPLGHPHGRRPPRCLRAGCAAARSAPEELGTSPIRACSWGCSSRSGWSAAASTPAGRCESSCRATRRRRRADRYAPRSVRAGGDRPRADRLVRFAESRAAGTDRWPKHLGEMLEEDCGMCDVCSPLASPESPRRPRPCCLPEDVAGAIHGPRSTCAGRSAHRSDSAPRLDGAPRSRSAHPTSACSPRPARLTSAGSSCSRSRVRSSRSRARTASVSSAPGSGVPRIGSGAAGRPRRALRTSVRLATRAGAGRRGARIRRPARRRSASSRPQAGTWPRSRRRQGLRSHEARAATPTTHPPSSPKLIPTRPHSIAFAVVQQEHGGRALVAPDPQASPPRAPRRPRSPRSVSSSFGLIRAIASEIDAASSTRSGSSTTRSTGTSTRAARGSSRSCGPGGAP